MNHMALHSVQKGSLESSNLISGSRWHQQLQDAQAQIIYHRPCDVSPSSWLRNKRMEVTAVWFNVVEHKKMEYEFLGAFPPTMIIRTAENHESCRHLRRLNFCLSKKLAEIPAGAGEKVIDPMTCCAFGWLQPRFQAPTASEVASETASRGFRVTFVTFFDLGPPSPQSGQNRSPLRWHLGGQPPQHDLSGPKDSNMPSCGPPGPTARPPFRNKPSI